MTDSIPRYSSRERAILSVSQLNRMARSLLEDAFPSIWVEGEISNYSRAASGHWYFTLKDVSAQVRCAMFRSANLGVRVRPADGMQVMVRGRISLYEARGDYQLLCDSMEESGLGRLQRQFEALKQKLAAEGLFDSAAKRSPPRIPQRLAIITSAQGAAIRDVLSVLSRRWPQLKVDLWPAPVQGNEAPAALLATLREVDALRLYDLILLTRGGGSLEDLWAFNDEALVRAVAATRTPIVCAVGHEIDFTLCDFAADVRAPTPSAAGELIVPDQADIMQRLHGWGRQLRLLQQRRTLRHAQGLDHAERLLRAHDPRRQVALLAARLQQLESRLRRALVDIPAQLSQRLDRGKGRLEARSPRQILSLEGLRATRLQTTLHETCRRQLRHAQTELQTLEKRWHRQDPATVAARRREHLGKDLSRLRAALEQFLSARQQRLALARSALRLLGPQATLERGYVLLADAHSGRLLQRRGALQPGQMIRARFADGEANLHADAGITPDGA